MKERYPKLSNQIVSDCGGAMIPIAVKKARNNTLYDYNNNKYYDFFLNNGSCILGYGEKTLSQNIKNSISRGFLSSFPSHLQKRAKQSIINLLSHYAGKSFNHFDVSFFYHKESLLETINYMKDTQHISLDSLLFDHQVKDVNAFIKDQSIIDINNAITICNQLYNITNHPYLIIGNIISNGFCIYALLSNSNNKIKTTNGIILTPIDAQTIITTSQILMKKPINAIFQKLLASYKDLIHYHGQGFFSLKNPPLKQTDLHLKLRAHCLFINWDKNLYSLNLQTSPDSIRYFFQVLKKIN